MNRTRARSIPILAALFVLLGAQVASAQSFDPRELEWKECTNQTLEFEWARPKHPKWRWETIDVGNGRAFVDQIVRAESPSAKPDMLMRIFGWSVQGSYKPSDFPSKSKDDLKSIISKDQVLASEPHKEFGNSIVQMFAEEDPNKFSQRAVLDRLLAYQKERDNKVKSFGKELAKILKDHSKGKYIREVPLNQASSGELAKYYLESTQYQMERPKASGIDKPKIGRKPFKAQHFTITGQHQRYNAKVTMEYYVFGGIKGHTMVVECIYWGGMEKDREIRTIKGMILDTFDKK